MKKNGKSNRRKNGEGSVYQRASDGRWAASLTVDGTRKHFFASTPAEVLAKLSAAREQKRKHLPFASETLTLGAWLDLWLENTRPPQVKSKTYIAYEYQTRLYLKPELGHIRLSKLQPQDVRNFMNNRLSAGLSPRTTRHLRNTLRCALNQAINDSLLFRNVAALVEPPQVPDRPLCVYDPAEARQLIAAAQGTRLEALLTAACAIGLRSGEVLGLQWRSINFERGTVLIEHNLQRVRRVRRGDVVQAGEPRTERLLGAPKSKKIKPLHLPEMLIAAFRRQRVRQDELQRLAGPAWKGGDYVFTSSIGTALEQRRLDIEFKRIIDAAGLRRVRFHDLRHSAASILIAQGVHPKAIQELLRHSSIQLTMDTYGHLFEQMQRETANQMDLALAPKPEPIAVKTAVRPRLTLMK